MDAAGRTGQFIVDVLRLAVWLGILAACFVPLERMFALRPPTARRNGIGSSIAYYFLSNLLPAVLLAVPAALLAKAAHEALPEAWFAAVTSLPLGLQFALALVVGEVGGYWGHRWCHESPWLWRFHAVHHSSEQLDWLANSRAHPVDMVFVRFCGLVPLHFFGLAHASPGADFAVAWSIMTTFWSFFVHANLRWRFGPIEWLLATPFFHHWHHSRIDHINHNYAAMFPWVDGLFGSLHLPREWPAAYGSQTAVPEGMPAQLMEPFAKEANANN